MADMQLVYALTDAEAAFVNSNPYLSANQMGAAPIPNNGYQGNTDALAGGKTYWIPSANRENIEYKVWWGWLDERQPTIVLDAEDPTPPPAP